MKKQLLNIAFIFAINGLYASDKITLTPDNEIMSFGNSKAILEELNNHYISKKILFEEWKKEEQHVGFMVTSFDIESLINTFINEDFSDRQKQNLNNIIKDLSSYKLITPTSEKISYYNDSIDTLRKLENYFSPHYQLKSLSRKSYFFEKSNSRDNLKE